MLRLKPRFETRAGLQSEASLDATGTSFYALLQAFMHSGGTKMSPVFLQPGKPNPSWPSWRPCEGLRLPQAFPRPQKLSQ